jgi:hypothetical protein
LLGGNSAASITNSDIGCNGGGDALQLGSRVRLEGLMAKGASLNGSIGVVSAWPRDAPNGRVQVTVHSERSHRDNGGGSGCSGVGGGNEASSEPLTIMLKTTSLVLLSNPSAVDID